MRETLTFILAGGRGERLDPLTRDRAKPAVPFGGIYRIIDYTLSNCINSGLRKIFVLTQYKSFSLQKHILSGWDEVVSTQLGEFIDVVPAQQQLGSDWYKGTADAIYQNLHTIKDNNKSKKILILAGDHIYQMDYRDMSDALEANGADAIVACVPMPKETSPSFGVIEVDDDGQVTGFKEKPADPITIPGQPDKIYASMGIYLFDRETLLEELELDSNDPESSHDFGKNIIPNMLERNKKVYVFNFMDEHGNTKYWRDIGTRDAYFEANLDLVRPDSKLDIFDKTWPVRTSHSRFPPMKVQDGGTIINALVGGGTVIKGGHVELSVISPNVRILKDAEVKDSMIMEGVVVGEGAKIRNAIIDKEVLVPPGTQIGYDKEMDAKRFSLTTSGIVIVPKRTRIEV